MKIRRAAPLAACIAIVGLLGLSACGGDSESSTTAPADADVVVRAVEGIAWDAEEYSAEAGDVTLYGVNASSIAHNLYVLADDDSVVGDYIDLPKRNSDGTRVFPLEAGTYKIVCKIPGHANMTAALVVS